jgi:hypothetical protein
MQSDEGYWELLDACWSAGEEFIIVEQDIVVLPKTLDELELCPHDWCAAPYPYLDEPAAWGLGCTKFSDRIMARHPRIMEQVAMMSNEQHPPKHWCTLDAFVWKALTDAGETRHEHGHVVGHIGSDKASHGCFELAPGGGRRKVHA